MQLTLNSSKTQFFTIEEFEVEYCKNENDQLGEFETVINDSPDDLDYEDFEKFLDTLLEAPRPRGWSRVLRRYCTLARKARSTSLLPMVPELMFQEPNAARHLLEYRSSFPIRDDDVIQFAAALGKWGDLYDEIDCLLLEMLSIAPNDDSANLRTTMTELCEKVVVAQFATRSRLASSAVVGLGKYGEIERVAAIGERLRAGLRSDSPARQQLALVLRGLGVWTNAEATSRLRDPSVEAARHLRFLSAIENGDERAFGAAMQVLQPSEKKDPDRLVLRPRALFLAKAIQKGQPQKWMAASQGWKKSLLALPDEFQDRAAMRVLDWH
jgi:hypothetical protein